VPCCVPDLRLRHAVSCSPQNLGAGGKAPVFALTACSTHPAALPEHIQLRMLLYTSTSCNTSYPVHTAGPSASRTGHARAQVGRPRPSFLARCFQDNKDFDAQALNGFAINPYSVSFAAQCTNPDKGEVADAYQSFPSGHASCSSAGNLFVTLYLLHRLRVFQGNGSPAAAALALTPLAYGTWVGLTRISDCAHPLGCVCARGARACMWL
jgi:membrane-associated phospholipid phosphatase